LVNRVREAIDEFRRSQEQPIAASLFPDPPGEPELRDPLKSRCATLLSVLSPA
jgi:hypothetical protein